VLSSLAVVVFIGSSSTLTPKGTYAMPDANGLRCDPFHQRKETDPRPRRGVCADSSTRPLPSPKRMTLFSAAMAVISLPMTIIVNRAIVTAHRLPWSPAAALRLLLTPYERSRPWVMFRAPGLLAATTLAILWVTVVASGVRALVVEELAGGILKDPSSSRDGPFARIRTGRLLLFLAFQAASTLIL
jgi:hypothetical protein